MKKLISFAYVAVLIVMGAATFIEAAEGTPFVHRTIYGTWWFVALWALLALLGAIYIIRYKALWKKPTTPTARPFRNRVPILLLHASFLIILLGALLTHFTGRSGTIYLRLHEPQDIAEIEHNGERYYHRLDFSVELTGFQIIEDEEGNAKDYCSEFRIGEEKGVVSMNNIYKHGNIRFYQLSYDSDLCGSTLMINRDPYGIPVTYCGYVLLFLSFIALCLKNLGSLKLWLPTVALTGLWCVYYFVLDGSWSQIPVLRHPLLIFHVVIIILAYALLLIQTIISAWALIKNEKRIFSVMHPALCLLSIGIFLGAIWANISWGNYWTWDSKETWALITLMIYAIPVHRRSLQVFNNPKVFHIYMLLAFLTVLMTYFGANYFLTGMHSYK